MESIISTTGDILAWFWQHYFISLIMLLIITGLARLIHYYITHPIQTFKTACSQVYYTEKDRVNHENHIDDYGHTQFCPKCLKVFLLQPQKLQDHLKRLHFVQYAKQPAPYTSLCGKNFDSLADHFSHEYSCAICQDYLSHCGHRFRTKESRIYHELHCKFCDALMPLCGKRFVDSAQLLQHQSTCQECNRLFEEIQTMTSLDLLHKFANPRLRARWFQYHGNPAPPKVVANVSSSTSNFSSSPTDKISMSNTSQPSYVTQPSYAGQPNYRALGPPGGYNMQGGPGIQTNNPSHLC